MCSVTTISDFLARYDVKQVDPLKVDVEQAEMDV